MEDSLAWLPVASFGLRLHLVGVVGVGDGGVKGASVCTGVEVATETIAGDVLY